MDYLPTKILPQLVEHIIEWIVGLESGVDDEVGVYSISISHLSVVFGYVSKLDVEYSDFSLRMYKKFYLNKIWHLSRRFDPRNYQEIGKMVVSFTEGDLMELFKVPKLSGKENILKKSQLLTVFFDFLLQLILYHSMDGRYFNSTLLKELRFLITILGDTLFQDTDELEEITENLLAEFEGVANKAGNLVHSLIFANTDQEFEITDEIVGVLLQQIELLKANSIKFLKLLPDVASTTGTANSLFVVDSLLCDLEDLIDREDNRIVDQMGEIKTLHQELILSQLLLDDIKKLQNSENKELKEIVMSIREQARAAEYLINSFLVSDAPLWYLRIRLVNVIEKIKVLVIDLQEIKKHYDNLGGVQAAEDLIAQQSMQVHKRNYVVDDTVVGFEDIEMSILDQLVGGTQNLQIISILGMPGLGKTTLARKLYNNPYVNYHFDKCSWCVVSQTYQRKSILMDILISVASDLDESKILHVKEETLAEHIYKSLKGRRYLIVMDDIWDSNAWDDIRNYFPDDGNGSRILFTSRNKDVAPPNGLIYTLPYLSNDQCWELVEKKVFRGKPCPRKLIGIGKEIAANCHGLPLAAVIIAGILSNMAKKKSTWKYVRGSLASFILSDQNNAVFQILKLSYKHLVDHLRPCFLYFGVFPEDTEIPAKKLKWLWIAEGFIHKEENKTPESIAEEYLMDLIDKSLVIVTKRRSDGGAKACVVHDLLRDLCLRITEEEIFLKTIHYKNPMYGKQFRLFVDTDPFPKASPKFLLPLGLRTRSIFGQLPDISVHVRSMKLLRVMDLPMDTLKHGGRSDLLVQLRYLTIGDIRPSIEGLVNLLALTVVYGIFPLSSVIQKMTKLRYLSVERAVFDQDCDNSHTNNLESLSCAVVRELRDEKMLKCLPNLRKLKCECAPFVDEQGVYRYPDLHFLTQLESLYMTTSHQYDMAKINFPDNIKKLTLHDLFLPWRKMSIVGGLPNLQILKLESNAFVGDTWATRDDEFQQLRILKLKISGLTRWNIASSEHFPKLQQLVLCGCSNLRKIPCEMGEILTLQLIEVELCEISLQVSARKIQEQQREMGNEELRVIIKVKNY